jgi:purine-binding chemotaxis protein CheW
MSTEFNPMEGLLADLLSTWDEEPAEFAEPPSAASTAPAERAAEPLTSSSPVPPETPETVTEPEVSTPEVVAPPPVAAPIPFISALLPSVPREPIFLDTSVAAKAPEPEPVVEVIAPAWTEDAGAAAACAAILARMEREFSEREAASLPARKTRLGSDAPRYVVFVVRDMMFAVPIGRVLETDRMTPVTPLPGAAPGVKGLTNLRGEVVPVIDLREVLGWAPPDNPTARRMLVIQDGNRQPLTALLVDQVKGLAAFPATAWKAAEIAGAHSAEGFVEAVAERDREWVSRLNLDRVLNETHLPSLAAA